MQWTWTIVLTNTSVLFSALEFTQDVRSRGKLHRFYNQDYFRKKVLEFDSSLKAAHEAFMVWEPSNNPH